MAVSETNVYEDMTENDTAEKTGIYTSPVSPTTSNQENNTYEKLNKWWDHNIHITNTTGCKKMFAVARFVWCSENPEIVKSEM